MKTKITLSVRLLCLLMAMTLMITGCASGNAGNTTANSDTEKDSVSDESQNVSVENQSGSVVGSPETEAETEKETETEDTQAEAPAVPELSEEEKLWQDRLAAVVESNLNVRAEANPDSDMVGKMTNGAMATVLERAGEWSKIKSGNVEGWVKNEFCVFGMDAKALAEPLSKTMATVTTDVLRIRQGASTDSETLSQLERDDTIEVDTKAPATEGWVAVKYNDTTAYVSAQYVNVETTFVTALTLEEVIEKERKEEELRKLAEAERLSKKYAEILANSSDMDLFAALIYCEAGSYGYEGMLAVAAVVVNRMEHPGYPSTLREVIFAKGQFSPIWDGLVGKALAEGKASETCYQAARDALAGMDNTNGCRSFRSTKSGFQGLVIGGNVFFNNH